MNISLLLRYRLFAFIVLAAALPLVVYGAQKARQSNSNRVQDWLPEHLEETQRLFWFSDRFGSDELLMISWEGCRLDDPRLSQLAVRLLEPIELEQGKTAPAFRAVITGGDALERLTAPPLELPPDEARRRLENWLIGRDGESTGAVALISDVGMVSRKVAVEHVFQSADAIDGLSRDSIHVAGSTIESVAIDQASSHGLKLMTLASLALCFALMYFCLGRVSLALMVFLAAVYSEQLSMALMYFTGSQMDSIALMVPTLVYVLGISAGVHLVNYYRDALSEGSLDDAAARAARYAWTPCLLAAGTTALGLVSLAVSQLTPIRRFGVYAALGVVCGLALLFLLLPALLKQFPPQRYGLRSGGTGGVDRLLDRLCSISTGHHQWVAGLGMLLVGVAVIGVLQIRATARLHDMFPPNARVIRDYAWLEEHIGPLVPVEVVVRIRKPVDVSFLTRLQLVDSVEQAIVSVDGIGSAVSAVTYAPQLEGTRGAGLAQTTLRAAVNSKLKNNKADFIEHRFLYETDEVELWRISARAKASSGVDYGELLKTIRHRVDAVIAAEANELHIVSADAVYSGSIPLVHKAQGQLLSDLTSSFLVAFVVIAAAMVLLLRSVSAGLLSMIPNVLPSVVVFGAMGWAGAAIEVGSMMTASAALGIAVDDTLHFVTWFRRGLAAGLARHEAVRFAYQRCGAAMIQTSLICSLGLMVFGLSEFVPIARFAWLMAAMLGAALVGDLIVLPAILAGPLGRVFEPRNSAMPLDEAVAASVADEARASTESLL